MTSSSTGGAGGLSAGSSSFSLFAFFFRCRQNKIRHSMTMSTARPPTTPPAMAPTLLLFDPDDGLAVLDGMDRVGVRETEAALSV